MGRGMDMTSTGPLKHTSGISDRSRNVAGKVTEVWDSSRQKPGRRFEPTHELFLHEQAIRLSHELRGASRGLVLVRELSGPIGIPDLTALVGDTDFLEQRLALDVPPLTNQIDAAISAVLYAHASSSIETIAKRLAWPTETIERRLPRLLTVGAVIRAGRTGYLRPEALQPAGRIIAMEAKVRDWRRALIQARSYSVWADNYVLIMGPLSAISMSRLTEEVATDGGGLVVDGQWIVRPKARHLRTTQKMWASEHLVAGLVDASNSDP